MRAKTMNISVPEECRDWVQFEAARRGLSMASYLKALIEEDRDSASDEVKDAYKVFCSVMVAPVSNSASGSADAE